jgi:hypothetical protein
MLPSELVISDQNASEWNLSACRMGSLAKNSFVKKLYMLHAFRVGDVGSKCCMQNGKLSKNSIAKELDMLPSESVMSDRNASESACRMGN